MFLISAIFLKKGVGWQDTDFNLSQLTLPFYQFQFTNKKNIPLIYQYRLIQVVYHRFPLNKVLDSNPIDGEKIYDRSWEISTNL